MSVPPTYPIPKYVEPVHPLAAINWPPGPIDDRQLRVLTTEQIQQYLVAHFKKHGGKRADGSLACCHGFEGADNMHGHDQACKYNPYRSHFNMCCGSIGHAESCKNNTWVYCIHGTFVEDADRTKLSPTELKDIRKKCVRFCDECGNVQCSLKYGNICMACI